MKCFLTNVTGPGVVPDRCQPADARPRPTPHRVQARAPVILRIAALTPALEVPVVLDILLPGHCAAPQTGVGNCQLISCSNILKIIYLDFNVSVLCLSVM